LHYSITGFWFSDKKQIVQKLVSFQLTLYLPLPKILASQILEKILSIPKNRQTHEAF
jgi:hypothetical protein